MEPRLWKLARACVDRGYRLDVATLGGRGDAQAPGQGPFLPTLRNLLQLVHLRGNRPLAALGKVPLL